MILERIRPCADCQRMTRPSKSTLRDHPDTVVRGSAERCLTCYLKVRGRTTRKPKAPKPVRVASLSSIVLASVPDYRYPQRADCRPSCCKTPYNCARGFQCRCHREGS